MLTKIAEGMIVWVCVDILLLWFWSRYRRGQRQDSD